MRLTWADLITDDLTPAESGRWLAPWAPVIRGPVSFELMTKFGLWFLGRPDGSVEMLDVFTGAMEPVAASHEAFRAEVNDPAWQEVYLFAPLVHRLHGENKVAGPRECYALAPHPALGGRNPLEGDPIDTRFVLVMDAGLWQDLCVQSLGL